jgi:hypothetical protein
LIIEHLEWEFRHLLARLRKTRASLFYYRHHINHFHIKQLRGHRMALLPIAPGFSPVFTATPAPAGTFPAPGNLPTWASDSADVTLAVDATGLVATAAISATATVGATFTLSISYTNADGTVATGSAQFTIVAAPVPDITSFSIAQTA